MTDTRCPEVNSYLQTFGRTLYAVGMQGRESCHNSALMHYYEQVLDISFELYMIWKVPSKLHHQQILKLLSNWSSELCEIAFAIGPLNLENHSHVQLIYRIARQMQRFVNQQSTVCELRECSEDQDHRRIFQRPHLFISSICLLLIGITDIIIGLVTRSFLNMILVLAAGFTIMQVSIGVYGWIQGNKNQC